MLHFTLVIFVSFPQCEESYKKNKCVSKTHIRNTGAVPRISRSCLSQTMLKNIQQDAYPTNTEVQLILCATTSPHLRATFRSLIVCLHLAYSKLLKLTAASNARGV